jgi:hypothetical protein
MDMARLEIPVSGWTCLRTKVRDALAIVLIQFAMSRCICGSESNAARQRAREKPTFVDVAGVGLLPGLASLLLLA